MRLIISILFLSGFIASCKKSNISDVITKPRPDSINGAYLFTKEIHSNSSEASGTAYLSYNSDGKIIKREGGYINIPVSGGYSQYYVREIFDTLIYLSSDKAVIEAGDDLSGIITLPSKREMVFSNGMLVKKIVFADGGSITSNDTTLYFYNTGKQIEKTEQYFSNKYFTKNFTFDSKGNLLTAIGTMRSRSSNQVVFTSEETFSGYDDKYNSLEQFYWWDNIFLRSLSVNNFTRYTYQKKDPLNNVVAQEQVYWQLVYDGNGNVDWAK